MSHNLETRDGIVSFAENGRKERAWHNLGQVFDGPMTVKEALEASRANYKVELQPIVSVSPQMMSAIEKKKKKKQQYVPILIPSWVLYLNHHMELYKMKTHSDSLTHSALVS